MGILVVPKEEEVRWAISADADPDEELFSAATCELRHVPSLGTFELSGAGAFSRF